MACLVFHTAPVHAGATREGILTYTTLDASQHSQGARTAKPAERYPSRPHSSMLAQTTPAPGAAVPDGFRAQKQSQSPAAQRQPADRVEKSTSVENPSDRKGHMQQASGEKSAAHPQHNQPPAACPQDQEPNHGARVGDTVNPSAAAPNKPTQDARHHHVPNSQEGGPQPPDGHNDSRHPCSPRLNPASSVPILPLQKPAGQEGAVGAGAAGAAFLSTQQSTSQHNARLVTADMSADTPHKSQPAHVKQSVEHAAAQQLTSPPGRVNVEQSELAAGFAGQQAEADIIGSAVQPGKAPAAELQGLNTPNKAALVPQPAVTGAVGSKAKPAHLEWLHKRSSSDSREAQTTVKAKTQEADAAVADDAVDKCATSSCAEPVHQRADEVEEQSYVLHNSAAVAGATDAKAREAGRSEGQHEQEAMLQVGHAGVASASAAVQQNAVDTAEGCAVADGPTAGGANDAAAASSKQDGRHKITEGSLEGIPQGGPPVRAGGWAGKLKSLFSLAGKGNCVSLPQLVNLLRRNQALLFSFRAPKFEDNLSSLQGSAKFR